MTGSRPGGWPIHAPFCRPRVATARHDVHPMPGKGEGYVVDVQADLLALVLTRTVMPLLPEETALDSLLVGL